MIPEIVAGFVNAQPGAGPSAGDPLFLDCVTGNAPVREVFTQDAAARHGSARSRAGNADETRTRRADRSDSGLPRPPAYGPCRSSRGRESHPAACACRDATGARAPPRQSRFPPARPRYMTPTWVAMYSTTARLWEMNRQVRPRLAWSSRIRLRTCAWTETSSADVGSSHTRNSGFEASARAMEMRCRCPPENSCGYRSTSRAPRPTCASSSATRVRCAARSASEPVGVQRFGDDGADAPPRDSSSRTDPGRSSACVVAASSLRHRPSRRGPSRRTGCARATAHAVRRRAVRRSISRNRTRPPDRAYRHGGSRTRRRRPPSDAGAAGAPACARATVSTRRSRGRRPSAAMNGRSARDIGVVQPASDPA